MKIIIDGNIACGKSTLIKMIANSNDLVIPTFLEDLNDWGEWLKLFYSNMDKYSFGFQMKVLKSHLDKKDIKDGIFERSPLSCQKVFGELLFEDNHMNQLEWDLTNNFNNSYGWEPTTIIYIKCDPEICYQRIKERNRIGEENISLEYLKRVHSKYEKLYNNMNVITIDGTLHIDTIYDIFINNFI